LDEQKISLISSTDHKFSTLRHPWITLIESEGPFGLPKTQSRINARTQSGDMITSQIPLECGQEVRQGVPVHHYVSGEQCLDAWKGIGIGMGLQIVIVIKIGTGREE
jgi:hypothetical protein